MIPFKTTVLVNLFQVPRDDEGEPLYEELICPSCTTSLDFLSYYDELLVSIPDSSKHKEGEFTENNCTNMRNVYNQNFTGVYCTCKRPYPDPDCEEDMGEMLQCCVCEDWFHEVHLGLASTEEV